MTKSRLANLSAEKLCRLTAGMTRREVETILGPYLRPNVCRGRRFYAWIGKGTSCEHDLTAPRKRFPMLLWIGLGRPIKKP
jgi:hypothetical protein